MARKVARPPDRATLRSTKTYVSLEGKTKEKTGRNTGDIPVRLARPCRASLRAAEPVARRERNASMTEELSIWAAATMRPPLSLATLQTVVTDGKFMQTKSPIPSELAGQLN
jgi:hypothetical protein